jgi:hypothetical protein
MSKLQEWSEIIQRQGEERYQRDLEEAAQAKAALPEFVDGLATKPISELLDLFLAYSQPHRNSFLMEEWKKYVLEIRNAILSRTRS